MNWKVISGGKHNGVIESNLPTARKAWAEIGRRLGRKITLQPVIPGPGRYPDYSPWQNLGPAEEAR